MAMYSVFLESANSTSARSFSVIAESVRRAFGAITPLRDVRSPGTTTSQISERGVVALTVNSILPSSSRSCIPALMSRMNSGCGSWTTLFEPSASSSVSVILSPMLKVDRLVGDLADADFRSLNVAQNGDDRAFFVGDAAHIVDGFAVRLVIAMREIDACHIQPGADHLAQRFLVAGGGANGGDDFGAFAVDAVADQSQTLSA